MGGKSLHVGLPLNGSAVIYLSAQTLSSLLRGQLDAASARSSGQLALEGGSSADRESAIDNPNAITNVFAAIEKSLTNLFRLKD